MPLELSYLPFRRNSSNLELGGIFHFICYVSRFIIVPAQICNGVLIYLGAGDKPATFGARSASIV